MNILTPLQQQALCDALLCEKIINIEPMQSLWAGKGELVRLTLQLNNDISFTPKTCSVVVKKIDFQAGSEHPYGWHSTFSEQRKRKSYQVEFNWYRQFGEKLNARNTGAIAMSAMYFPKLVYSESSEQGMILALEDLAPNFPQRFTLGKDDRPSHRQIKSCIRWLTLLHAKTLSFPVSGLWAVGGYWHLETRPDEWQAITDLTLKRAAKAIDERLRLSPYQCIIHGDAKLANFCFSECNEHAAAVDFQYVGQGPGVKDLMLLLSSVMPDTRLQLEASSFVDFYFKQLRIALAHFQPQVNANDVIANWRSLYPMAWADFHRFLTGWKPGHWKIGGYCKQQTDIALSALSQSADGWG
ncbi:phosphotransferase [Thalassotalea aquiviva]|uniref:phosphotransferase n=1 Tax=Thalassotalea aquiviva TaxID=3242415 RepID=UPI00352A8036